MSLIVALLLLLVMLMLGMSGAQTSVLQEKMAGGTRNRDLAFQAAEAALGAAGDSLTKTTIAAANTYIGSADHDNNKAWWTQRDWNHSTCAALSPVGCQKFSSSTLDKVASQPVYYVERLADSTNGSANYRITARGVGQDSDTVVILQAVYNVP